MYCENKINFIAEMDHSYVRVEIVVYSDDDISSCDDRNDMK